MTDQPDSVERLIAEMTVRGYGHWSTRIEALFAAERERYAKLEADYDKLTEMYEKALREREGGP